jgi:anti-sigma B factor antagonist
MAAPLLRLDVRLVDRAVVITADGEIDIATAPTLRAELLRQVDADVETVILDLCKVTFMDSSGLGVVIAALNRTTSRGSRFSVVCPAGKLRRIFEITGVASRVAMSDSLDAALAAPA